MEEAVCSYGGDGVEDEVVYTAPLERNITMMVMISASYMRIGQFLCLSRRSPLWCVF